MLQQELGQQRLALLLGLWFHVQRISRADVLPPRRLMLGTGVSLLLLAVLAPVVSQAPAESSVLPASLPVDWFVLFPHPLMYATTPMVLWLVVVLGIGALLTLPLLRRRLPADPHVPDRVLASRHYSAEI